VDICFGNLWIVLESPFLHGMNEAILISVPYQKLGGHQTGLQNCTV
jgi:hypothetical protein